jgi:hypothetical protein
MFGYQELGLGNDWKKTKVPFSYVHEFIWYEVNFVTLDIIAEATHHNPPLTWDMNGGI